MLVRTNSRNDGFYNGRILLKLDGSDKFVGVGSNGKLGLVDHSEATYIKLNTMKDISQKTLEGRNNKVLTEVGFWFFPKSYSFKENSNGSRQAYRLVYYEPDKYILMKGDSCLGFNSSKKFKKVSCKLDSASIFNICTNPTCSSYIDIRNGINDIKNEIRCMRDMILLNVPKRGGYKNRHGDDSTDTSSSNDSIFGGKYPKNKWKGSLKNEDDSDDSDDMYAGCKEFRYGSFSDRYYPDRYDWGDHFGGKGKPTKIIGGGHNDIFGYGRPGGSFRC